MKLVKIRWKCHGWKCLGTKIMKISSRNENKKELIILSWLEIKYNPHRSYNEMIHLRNYWPWDFWCWSQIHFSFWKRRFDAAFYLLWRVDITTGTSRREEKLKEVILTEMRKYGIQSSILTMLKMYRRNLVTKEKVKKSI